MGGEGCECAAMSEPIARVDGQGDSRMQEERNHSVDSANDDALDGEVRLGCARSRLL